MAPRALKLKLAVCCLALIFALVIFVWDGRGGADPSAKLAVTAWSELIVTVHAPRPVQAPDQARLRDSRRAEALNAPREPPYSWALDAGGSELEAGGAVALILCAGGVPIGALRSMAETRRNTTEEGLMAIVVLSETPNMTREQYDSVATELGLSDSLPEGCLAHVAGVGPDGSTWRDISVWESAGQARQFMDTTLRPAMERAGASPIWGPPANWNVHKLIV